GELVLDAEKYTVMVQGELVVLTRKEFELLKLLLENKGIVLTRNRILENIWGYDFDGETRTVDVHIRTLRSKLGGAGAMIETVRGIGYKANNTQEITE
ncbi:MAG: winged helix-turn-helix domain-containing protein, partial [Oscillospiraceae bacterium]